MGLKGAALQSKAVCSFIVISQWIIGFSWQDTSGPNVTYSRAGRRASTARFHT